MLAVATAVPFSRGSIQNFQPLAEVTSTPSANSFKWPLDPEATAYEVSRKPVDSSVWTVLASLPGTSTGFVDAAAPTGSAVDYRIVQRALGARNGQMQPLFLRVGDRVPLVESRGRLLLLVDNTHTTTLEEEIFQLMLDLSGDGWEVVRRDVDRTSSVAVVKALIKAFYDADPGRSKSVFLLGRIAVPYAGAIMPDGHYDHYGAWPADVFYGEVEGQWTDSTVNVATGRLENHNTPGDGKFDQSIPPAALKLAVGRVDLSGLSSFPGTEADLLRRYLRKNHDYRHGRVSVLRKGLIDDNFGVSTGEPFALNGWGNFSVAVGRENVRTGDFTVDLQGQPWMFAYGCGPGGFGDVGGVASTGTFANTKVNAVFTMLMGSYFGDWNTADNVLRAPLAGEGSTLACAWAGRPNWFLHPMALGGTLGECTLLSQNNLGTYGYAAGTGQVHVALMGDPTLRLFPVKPASNLQVVKAGTGATISWSRSADVVEGYHLYVADSPTGPYTRVNNNLLTGTSFSYGKSPTGKTFMLRAVKLETTPSGSFYNPSQGVFASLGGVVIDLPAVGITATDASAAEDPQKQGAVQITRSGSTAAALTVNLNLSGQATNAADYAAISQNVTIPAGAASVSIPVQPVADSLIEGTEAVVIAVAPAAGYTVTSENAARVEIQDADRDDWRFSRFTADELANPSISSFSADPDADGISNLCEYGFLLDPKKGNEAGLPLVSVYSDGTSRYLQVTYRRNKNAHDVNFSVQVSSDPEVTWNSGASFTETVSVTDNGDGSERVIARDRSPLGSTPRRFMRVKLEM